MKRRHSNPHLRVLGALALASTPRAGRDRRLSAKERLIYREYEAALAAAGIPLFQTIMFRSSTTVEEARSSADDRLLHWTVRRRFQDLLTEIHVRIKFLSRARSPHPHGSESPDRLAAPSSGGSRPISGVTPSPPKCSATPPGRRSRPHARRSRRRPRRWRRRSRANSSTAASSPSMQQSQPRVAGYDPSLLAPNPQRGRVVDRGLDELASSLDSHGQQEPIVARLITDTDRRRWPDAFTERQRLLILKGHRIHAAQPKTRLSMLRVELMLPEDGER